MSEPEDPRNTTTLPFATSVGYQVRMANRAIQRALHARIEAFGVTQGMWYFLRALWEEDGLTQSELCQRIGTMEPTAVVAIAAMERKGLIVRQRNRDDLRKVNLMLTPAGWELKARMLPIGIDVIDVATKGFSGREVTMLLSLLHGIQKNLEGSLTLTEADTPE